MALLLPWLAACAWIAAEPGLPRTDDTAREVALKTPDVDRPNGFPACRDADLQVPGDHPTVQAAVNAADLGQSICVGSGVWAGPVAFGQKSLTLFGEEGSANTTLEGTGGPVVTADLAAEVLLGGFTIRGGRGTKGGGVAIGGVGNFLGYDLLFIDNSADTEGGGMYALDSGVSLVGCAFGENQAPMGGGIRVLSGSVNLWDSLLVANRATSSGGGGVALNGAQGVFIRLELIANEADPIDGEGQSLGGGVWVYGGSLDGGSVRFVGNRAELGGGIYTASVSHHNLTNVDFIGNLAETGGAAMVQNGTTQFSSAVFGHNSASKSGGALSVVDGETQVTYSDFWQNGAAPYPETDVPGMAGNLFVDPLFTDATPVDPVDWDTRPRADSPLVDAGQPDVQDPDGTRADVGAYGGSSAVW